MSGNATDGDTSSFGEGGGSSTWSWVVLLGIAGVGVALPLYVYFTKKYCPKNLPRCFQLRGERESWPQRHKGGMFRDNDAGTSTESEHSNATHGSLEIIDKI